MNLLFVTQILRLRLRMTLLTVMLSGVPLGTGSKYPANGLYFRPSIKNQKNLPGYVVLRIFDIPELPGYTTFKNSR
jgi:hypothetical protein